MNASTMTLSQILNAASDLSVEQQLALNKALCEMIKSQRRQKLALVGAAFRIGQIVRFNAKTKGMKSIKIEKFNRAGTAVVGFEVNTKGEREPFGTRWTVANSLCSIVG